MKFPLTAELPVWNVNATQKWSACYWKKFRHRIWDLIAKFLNDTLMRRVLRRESWGANFEIQATSPSTNCKMKETLYNAWSAFATLLNIFCVSVEHNYCSKLGTKLTWNRSFSEWFEVLNLNNQFLKWYYWHKQFIILLWNFGTFLA